jgi:hypothetical protein
MKICRLLLAAAGTTVLFGTLVSGALARNLSTSNQSISAMWREVTFSGGFGEINCQLTLEGSMHSRTMPKVLGSLVGYITSAILGPCLQGTATILRETLPWHLRYSGFEGALPNIRSFTLHLVGESVSIREPVFGIRCHIRTTETQPGIGISHRSTATHELTEVGVGGRIRTTECGAEGTFSSVSGAISVQGRPEVKLSISLI